MRILHCLYDIGGNPGALARAEREIGLDSTAVVLRSQRFGFEMDEVLCGDDDGYLRQEWRRWGLLWRAARHFDVVHFNYGRSLAPPWKGPGSAAAAGVGGPLGRVVDLYLRSTWMRDVPLLRALGKGIFVTYQGDDARQGDWVSQHFAVNPVDEVEPGYYTKRWDETKRRGIARFARHADGMYALNPDLLHVLPQRARFMPYASVDPRQFRPNPPRGEGVPLVVHAPTHRGIKGTRHIVAAMERLRADGLDCRFILVENMTRGEAVRLYADADLVVDQLLVGWYGAFAVEAMAMAKPVVCYVRQDDLGFIPEAMRADLPLIDASPVTVEATLRTCLGEGRGRLVERGASSRRYAERWHDPRVIAARLADDYRRALRRPAPG